MSIIRKIIFVSFSNDKVQPAPISENRIAFLWTFIKKAASLTPGYTLTNTIILAPARGEDDQQCRDPEFVAAGLRLNAPTGILELVYERIAFESTSKAVTSRHIGKFCTIVFIDSFHCVALANYMAQKDENYTLQTEQIEGMEIPILTCKR